MFVLFVYGIYLFLTPYYFFSVGRTEVIETPIADYYDEGFLLNGLAVVCFILGYFLVDNQRKQQLSAPKYYIPNAHRRILLLFGLCFGIVLINIALGGRNVINILLGDRALGLGARGASYYLMNFVNGLISVIAIAALYRLPRVPLLAIIGSSFFIFSLLGFRFRILLSLFGLLIAFLYIKRLSSRQLFIILSGGMVSLYAILFFTYNREALFLRQGEIVLNPAEFEYEAIFEQTRGNLADMAVIRGFDIKGLEHDYGATTLLYPFIRLIPRSILPNKDDYYPPPQLATTHKAYDPWWGKYSGEATTNIGALYIAGGWFGVALGNILMGLILKYFNNSIRFRSPLSVARNIVVTISLFQWITRGYFPQYVDTFAFMMIPILVLNYWKKPLKKRQSYVREVVSQEDA